MTDDLISAEAVEAAERAYETFGAGMRDALEAALPHLRAHQAEVRPVVGREALRMAIYNEGAYCGDCDYTDATCSGCQRVTGTYADAVLALLPTEAETKALAETATKLGVKLGRAEALKEIADEMGLSHAWQLDDPRINYVDVQIDKDTYRQIIATREEGR